MRLGVGLALTQPASMLQRLYGRAAFRLDSRINPSSGVPTDLSVNGLTIQSGSSSGADTNDPLWLSAPSTYGVNGYVYVPGSASNTISVPLPGGVTTAKWTATLSDGSTVSGTTASDPVIFGTEAGFSGGKSVTSFVVEDNDNLGPILVNCDFGTDPVNATHTEFTASTGQTVTVNRATAGRKAAVVEQQKWSLGTDDFFEVADNDLLDIDAATDFTVLVVLRQHATPTNFGRWVSKRGTTSPAPGWEIDNNSTGTLTYAVISDGTNSPSRGGLSAYTTGAISSVGLIVDRSAQTLVSTSGSALSATATISATGSAANALPLRIGRTASGTANFQDFELYAVYVWREVVTASELATIAADWGVA